MTYEFQHVFSGEKIESDFPIGKAPSLIRRGGKTYERVYTFGVVIPAYMRAEGSSGSSEGSCERQATYLKSDKHKADMRKAEAEVARTERAESSLKRAALAAQPKLDAIRKENALKAQHGS